MVEFKPDAAWRGRGAPSVEIPPKVEELAERTYRENVCAELPADPDDQDTLDLLRLLGIYARRKGRRLDAQYFDDDDGVTHLRFRLRDKRQYRSTTGLSRRLK